MTRRTYLTGEEGRAAYQARAARDTTPRGDPQRTATLADPREAAAAMLRPCATLLPGGGTCAAPMAEHHVPDRKDRREVRTYCTRQEGPRRCPCERYT